MSTDLSQITVDFGLRHYWTALLPVRLGEYPAVDSAAKTFVHAHHYSTSPSKEALRKVLRCYGETLRLLRNAMEKHNAAVLDETLMTVALVDLLAYSMKDSHAEGGNVPSLWGTTHSGGVVAVLRARPPDHRISEITRAIRLFMYGSTCFNPIGLGIPSPVDDLPQWWRVEPVGLSVLSNTIRILEKLRLQIEVRTPRLVVYVRKLRSNTRLDPGLAMDAVQLARELLALQDVHAEADLIRGFASTPTTDQADRAILPAFWQFPNAIEVTTAILYWEFRLLVINNVLELARMVTSFDSDLLDLRANQSQLIMQLLAAWQWGQEQGVYVSVHLAAAYVVVWAGLLRREVLNAVPVADVKRWLLPKIKHPLLEWTTDATEIAAEHAAEVLVGGPLPERG
ncbi:hypothetical protein LTR10_009971 [Elasticomyces elasticus]|nr:hypothetical protein LTR10_009971 [Elasticomyces elasticus]KAK4970263.1 hypothetical protein LTR42_008430 [Elasticomyces elasticus]